jgi:hypothetical protein
MASSSFVKPFFFLLILYKPITHSLSQFTPSPPTITLSGSYESMEFDGKSMVEYLEDTSKHALFLLF